MALEMLQNLPSDDSDAGAVLEVYNDKYGVHKNSSSSESDSEDSEEIILPRKRRRAMLLSAETDGNRSPKLSISSLYS